MSISNPFLMLVYWISCFASMTTTQHPDCITITTLISESKIRPCEELHQQYENIATCCPFSENMQCDDGKNQVTIIYCYCMYDKNPFSSCESSLLGGNTEEQCLLEHKKLDKETVHVYEIRITEYNTQNSTLSICDSVISSNETDMSYQGTLLSGHSPATTAPIAKTTHTTASIHSIFQNFSPSINQNSGPSAIVIGGVVGGVAILLTVTVLMLAAVCVIIAVKRSKLQGPDEASTEDMNDYTEVPEQLPQQQTSTDQMNNNEGYSTVNEWWSPDYATPTNSTATSHQPHIYTSLMNPEATDHGYANLIRSEEPISELTSNSEQYPQMYSTVIRQNGKKVTVNYTVSGPSEQHQNENPVFAEDKNELANENITSSPPSSNVSVPTGRDVQTSDIYSTVVREDGQKITIRVQTLTEEQDS